MIIFQIVMIYFLLGFVFALAFVSKGCSTIDNGANGAGIGVRLMMMPASILLWPLLLKKWLNANKVKDKQESQGEKT
ncbi:MAG: hypothetical protein ACI9Y1_002427 [Lentisphaeria bacterium]